MSVVRSFIFAHAASITITALLHCGSAVDAAVDATRASVVGVSGEGGEAKAGMKRMAERSRSAKAEPQTEAATACGPRQIAARHERVVCEAQRG